MKQKIHKWTSEKWQEAVDDINVRIDRQHAYMIENEGKLKIVMIEETIIE